MFGEKMTKKLTLEQTWRHCLAMWKWIAEEVKQEGTWDVYVLKIEWMYKHPQFGRIVAGCFFCQYDYEQGTAACSQCPGRLVSKSFHCQDHKTYCFSEKPVKFYQKLLELNKKRKEKK